VFGQPMQRDGRITGAAKQLHARVGVIFQHASAAAARTAYLRPDRRFDGGRGRKPRRNFSNEMRRA
jgi:hypothetical protein